MFQTSIETPIGRLLIEGTRDTLTAVRPWLAGAPADRTCSLLIQARKQLREYFKGGRCQFDLPFDLGLGTEFQRQVWQAIAGVPYGETTTYSDIARQVNRPTAQRAVGRAVAGNPFLIVVPCHRVLGSKGQLTGYSGGLKAKEWLLKHEGALII